MDLQKIKHYSIQYFKVWWIPILSYAVPFTVLSLGNILQIDFLIDVFLLLFYANILGNIIASIVQVVIKKWYCIFPQLGISALLFIYTSLYLLFDPPDYYGAHKSIPPGIEIYEALENKPTIEEIKKQNFVIYQSGQPGMYSYYTTIQPKDSGIYYIKAFEITSNDPLSEGRIRERSAVKVNIHNAEIYSRDFTIYEGSWGDKYGARIELWFAYKDTTYKVAEKNYIVEGWMR